MIVMRLFVTMIVFLTEVVTLQRFNQLPTFTELSSVFLEPTLGVTTTNFTSSGLTFSAVGVSQVAD